METFLKKRPGINPQSPKNEGFDGWIKCPSCQELIYKTELKKTFNCCPKCDHHYQFDLKSRIDLLTDNDTFKELFTNVKPVDSLGFIDTASYKDRLEVAFKKTGREDAICTGTGFCNGKEIALGVMDFSFMGGSMGSVVGERLTLLIEMATEKRLPLVVVTASGGARMQESVLSLMQMAKTSSAIAKLKEKKVPYISILTNPTTGGVTASFATLGDLIIAEPDALIAFAGPRVVEQTIGQKLPRGAQKSEFLLEKGMVDCIVRRADLKKRLSDFLSYIAEPD